MSSLLSPESIPVVLKPTVLNNADLWPIYLLTSTDLRNEIFNLVDEYKSSGKFEGENLGHKAQMEIYKRNLILETQQ